MTLTLWRSTHQVLCRMSLSLDVSAVFLVMRLGLWVWGEKTTEVKCPSHHGISGGTWCRHDLPLVMLTLITWLRVLFAKILYCNVTVFPLCSIFWKWALSPVYTQGERVEALLLGRETSINIAWNFSRRKVCLFSLIYLFIQSFVSVWSHVYLFYALAYNQIVYYLLLSLSIFGLWELVQVGSISFSRTASLLFPSALGRLLVLQDPSGWSGMFCPTLRISPFFKKP